MKISRKAQKFPGSQSSIYATQQILKLLDFIKMIIHGQQKYKLDNQFHRMVNSVKVIMCVILLSWSTVCLDSCCSQNTASIQGDGKVQIDPDTATISVRVQLSGTTSSDALSQVNAKINTLLSILSTNGIAQGDFSTSSITVSPQYNFNNGSQILVGQSASQSLTVKVKALDKSASKVGALITALSAVNNVTISGLSFSNSNQAQAQTQARKAAFNNAKVKFADYIALTKLKSGGIIQIIDLNSQNYTPFTSNVNEFKLAVQTLQVPYGKVVVSASVQIIYGLNCY